MQVMLDSHLSELYGIETKRLNEQVRRNIERFPEQFMFQLTDIEWDFLRSQFATLKNEDSLTETKEKRGTHRKYLPFAFTEQGVAMLSAVLRSDTAIRVSIQIMNAFVEMRKLILGNAALFQRLDIIERKHVEADKKFEQIFVALESKDKIPEKGLFFDGQIFDAWQFVSDLIRKANSSIVIIDNYLDDTVLSLLLKRKKGVSVTIHTKNMSKQLLVDLGKFNAQYEPIVLKEIKLAHDRFLIIDKKELYHLGASLKDLGKKWFAFSKMDTETLNLLSKLNELE
jgi:phage regulator Rha-like protein